MHYVYTLDLDSGLLTISHWRHGGEAFVLDALQLPLDAIQHATDLLYGCLSRIAHEPPSHRLTTAFDIQPVGSPLAINPSPPTQLNKLQYVVFTDFIYQWHFYSTSMILPCGSTFENMFRFAILRLAAWDLEVGFRRSD
jgi:hypothetical protein